MIRQKEKKKREQTENQIMFINLVHQTLYDYFLNLTRETKKKKKKIEGHSFLIGVIIKNN